MDEGLEQLSTQSLRDRVARGDTQVVDVRPTDAYNGWALRGEARGGHVAGARSLPFKWTAYLEWVEIVQGKGLRADAPLVVYGYDDEETERVGRLFLRAGLRDVSVYQRFVDEWCADASLPMERLARHTDLVHPEWLRDLLAGDAPPEHDGRPFVLCHTHYRNPGDYREGHIAGAVPVDTNSLESTTTWNRRTPAEIRDALLKLGITADTTVVLYGRFGAPDNDDPFPGSSAGQIAAHRAAFIMLWAGVKDVRVLNGGLQSWTDAGFGINTEETAPEPASSFGAEIPARPELAVDVPEAKEILASADANLVSVRSWPEYIGQVSGYDYIEPKGRIPGSVWGDCGSDAYHMENYRNLDHTMRESGEVEAIWRDVGVTPDKHNAFYCGTGWRGSEAWFNAWVMGWPRVSVFDGGWFEWSADPENPFETGIPEGMESR
jgi:thiosulfate/3-mercaptopyruvate sulfurtransferase